MSAMCFTPISFASQPRLAVIALTVLVSIPTGSESSRVSPTCTVTVYPGTDDLNVHHTLRSLPIAHPSRIGMKNELNGVVSLLCSVVSHHPITVVVLAMTAETPPCRLVIMEYDCLAHVHPDS